MMTTPKKSSRFRHPRRPVRTVFLAALLVLSLDTVSALHAQDAPSSQQPGSPSNPPADPNAGPATDNGTIILKKKKEADAPPAPVAPPEPKVKNPNNETYSIRVDVPIVNLDVNVILD